MDLEQNHNKKLFSYSDSAVYQMFMEEYGTPPDPDDYELAYEDLCQEMTNEMGTRNPSSNWRGTCTGFGWQRLSLETSFQAETGRDFLYQVLPKTENSFTVYDFKGVGFKIENAHHDAPTGGEWYTIMPAYFRVVNAATKEPLKVSDAAWEYLNPRKADAKIAEWADYEDVTDDLEYFAPAGVYNIVCPFTDDLIKTVIVERS